MAFPPTTPIIDDFNRASIGSTWTADPYNQSSTALSIASSTLLQGTNASFNESYYNVRTFGPDCQVYLDVPTLPSNNFTVSLGARIINPDSGTVDGYFAECLRVSGSNNDTWILYQIAGGVFTQLGATVTGPDIVAGDAIGLECLGNSISMWRRNSGTWTQIVSRTDSAVTSAGYFGGTLEGTTPRGDNFGGGDVTVPLPDAILLQRASAVYRM